MLKRIKSIDFLRGLTVFSMIIYHFFIKLNNQISGSFADFFNFFGYLAAPFFLIISGISFHIFVKNKKEAAQTKKEIFYEVIKRSIFIFILSTSFQILFGSLLKMKIDFFIYWSVFQVISFSMVLFFLIQFCQKSFRISILSILIVFIIMFEFIIHHYKLTFLYLFVEGTFEFVPWASFYLLGLIFGELFVFLSDEKAAIKLIPLIITGICSSIFMIFWINNYEFYYYVPYFFPNFILMLGIFCFLASIFYYLLDIKKVNFYFQEPIIRWGKLAFSVYYIHLGVIAMGIVFFPIFIENIYSKGFLLYQFIIILIIFFISLEIFIIIWKKYNYMFGIEWFMSRIVKKTLFLKKNIINQIEE